MFAVREGRQRGLISNKLEVVLQKKDAADWIRSDLREIGAMWPSRGGPVGWKKILRN